jgi:peptidoglycan/xylan/chitin deacetylase (PgdA/CDA1 family)
MAPDAGLRDVARAVRRTARRVRNRIRRASVVLLYHRVASGVADPWSLCVSPGRFREQMDVLVGRDVVALDALVADLDASRRRRSVAVTFDDGYADFATAALPVLAEHEIPATLFVATGALGGTAEFWWDALERVVLGTPRLPDSLFLDIGAEPFSWTAATDGDAHTLYLSLHRRLGRLYAAARERALAALHEWAGADPTPRATHRPLSTSELRAAAAAPLVRVGAHTVSHSYLSRLAEAEQRREIADSKARLEALTGAPIEHFSYPHGDHAPATIALVRETGFRVACGSAAAPVTSAVDRFDLPRVEVPDLPGDEFARWLDEWVG